MSRAKSLTPPKYSRLVSQGPVSWGLNATLASFKEDRREVRESARERIRWPGIHVVPHQGHRIP